MKTSKKIICSISSLALASIAISTLSILTTSCSENKGNDDPEDDRLEIEGFVFKQTIEFGEWKYDLYEHVDNGLLISHYITVDSEQNEIVIDDIVLHNSNGAFEGQVLDDTNIPIEVNVLGDFVDTESLRAINLSSIELNVEKILPAAFNNCENLVAINLDDVEEIFDEAFVECGSLQAIRTRFDALPLWTGERIFSNVNQTGGALNFGGIDNPTFVDYLQQNQSLPSGWNSDYRPIPLMALNIEGDTLLGLNEDFPYLPAFNALVIPNNIVSIAKGAFLEKFGSRGKFSNIAFLSFEDGSQLENIGGYSFRFCDSLTGELNIPDTVTTVGCQAFQGCKNITGDLYLSNNVEKVDFNAFSDCGFDGELTLSTNPLFTTLADHVFENCTKLSGELDIPSNITSINLSAFYNCSSLTGDLIIPDTVETIGVSAFSGCKGFSGTLKLSENPNFTRIENYAFDIKNSGLSERLIIPSNITFIGYCSFAYLDQITELEFQTPYDEIEINDKIVFLAWSSIGTVFVPAGDNTTLWHIRLLRAALLDDWTVVNIA